MLSPEGQIGKKREEERGHPEEKINKPKKRPSSDPDAMRKNTLRTKKGKRVEGWRFRKEKEVKERGTPAGGENFVFTAAN